MACAIGNIQVTGFSLRIGAVRLVGLLIGVIGLKSVRGLECPMKRSFFDGRRGL